jgi:hypothetical protein
VWECGTDDEKASVAVVVAHGDEILHLAHNYNVFCDLASKREEGDKDLPLYTPLRQWTVDGEQQKAVAVFAEVGQTWSPQLFRAGELTRQDVTDIVKQIEFFHKHGYIHCDVALRNLVRYKDASGAYRSVLIDAGAAVKMGGKWCGGTVNNASVAWLKKNFANFKASLLVEVPTVVDELWSFVFAMLDLVYPKRDRSNLIAAREEQAAFPAVAAIGKLVVDRKYDDVANAVADLLCLTNLKPPSEEQEQNSPEHPRIHESLPPASSSAAPAAQLCPWRPCGCCWSAGSGTWSTVSPSMSSFSLI